LLFRIGTTLPEEQLQIATDLHGDRGGQRIHVEEIHTIGKRSRSSGCCSRPAFPVWRALLNPILERGASKAYYHAAQYLSERRRLAGTVNDHRALPTHAENEAQLRERHSRKAGFWRRMSIRQ